MNTAARPANPAPLNRSSLLASFRHSMRRRLFLDYDGTLIGFFDRPEDAAPPVELRRILERLAGAPSNEVMIISGRGRRDLERWLGNIPGLWLAAEHGAFLRAPGEPWRSPQIGSPEWKDKVLPVLRNFTRDTPGSFIEEKEYALVWHFRAAPAGIAEPRSRELLRRLEEVLSGSEICATAGHKIVEVIPAIIHKGSVVEVIARERSPAGFWFATGDDRTDEDLFAAMPPVSWTVRVGTGYSCARYAVEGPEAITELLREMSFMP